MISKELAAQAIRLFFAEKWPVGTIARELCVHHSAIERVLRDNGVPASMIPRRRSIADPYMDFIREQLEKWPDIAASCLHRMVRERGYPGAPDHFRSLIARLRPRPAAEAFLRLRTLPGEQAQVDWAFFGTIEVDGHRRPLVAFVMVLSWSRRIYLRFGLDLRTGAFLAHHVAAFAWFGGVARVLLYDNLKSAVIARIGDAIHFNDHLLDCAAHYRYEPRPVAVYRGNQKGRVERSIRYIRVNFWPGRTFTSLEDLNAQAAAWCVEEGEVRRCPGDRTRTVADAYAEERPLLLALPNEPYPAEDRVPVVIGKTPYARFDGNDYTVPHTRVRRTVSIVASPTLVRVLDGIEEIAHHPRCWGKGKQIEDPAHVAVLVKHKAKAREARGMDRVIVAVPAVQELLNEIAHRGGNLGATVSGLGRLLDAHGAQDLALAVAEALRSDAPHLAAIRQILDRLRSDRGLPPPVAVPVPDNVRDLVVRPHNLSAYDQIGRLKGPSHD